MNVSELLIYGDIFGGGSSGGSSGDNVFIWVDGDGVEQFEKFVFGDTGEFYKISDVPFPPDVTRLLWAVNFTAFDASPVETVFDGPIGILQPELYNPESPFAVSVLKSGVDYEGLMLPSVGTYLHKDLFKTMCAFAWKTT